MKRGLYFLDSSPQWQMLRDEMKIPPQRFYMNGLDLVTTVLHASAPRKWWIGLLWLMMMNGITAAEDPWKAASELNKAEKFKDAAAAYSKLIQQNQKEERGYMGRGHARWRMNDFAGAIEDFDKAAELNPGDANTYYNRASAYNSNGQGDKAIDDYHKAIKLAPKDARSYNNLGFLLETRGEHDQAIDNYTKAIALLPTFPTYYNNRGEAWLGKGEYGKAMTDFDQAIGMKGGYSKAYRNRAGAWLVQGEFEKAIADSSRSLELSPQEARSLRIRSEAKAALGDSEGSKDDARQALILGPQSPFGVAVVVPPKILAREELALKALLAKDLPETRTRLAAARHDHAFAILNNPQTEPGKAALEEAVAYAKSATLLEPDHAGHWFLTGLLFRKLAALDERAPAMAEQALRQAVEIDSAHAASWLELGLMMADQMRGREAMTALENALVADPGRTASKATGLLCAMYALNDEGFRGVDFFQELYASKPEISALGVGAAIMLDYLGDREAALEQARDIMLVENPGTPDHAYAAMLVTEWKGEKP